MIIEEGSLRRAAERLHISQSAVTRQFCRRFGNFRPRFVSIGQANSLAELLVMSANEGAISFQPSYISHLSIPNVVMVPIAEKRATWDLSIVSQRGRMSDPLRALVDSFQLKAKS